MTTYQNVQNASSELKSQHKTQFCDWLYLLAKAGLKLMGSEIKLFRF